jgi:hypothetical protein
VCPMLTRLEMAETRAVARAHFFYIGLYVPLCLVSAKHLHIHMAGLCYAKQHVSAVTFLVENPDKTSWALSYDFYQEKLPYKLPLGRFMRNIFSL